MARVTVEDCIDKVENRFELVALAAQRAKDIGSGASITLDRENDKDSVIALREIAMENIKPTVLRAELIRRLQTRNKIDYPDDDVDQLDISVENVDDFDYISDNSDSYIDDTEHGYSDQTFGDNIPDIED